MRAKENGDVARALPKGWVLEPKYDGDRALGGKLGEEISLVGRGGNAGWMLSHFPEVAQSLTQLKRPAVLDGEIVAFDALGRAHHSTVLASDDRRFVAFDVLWTAEHGDIRHRPLSARRAILESLILEANDPRLLLAERLPGSAVEAVVEMCRRRGEGVMAKRADSPYEGGGARSSHWLKLKPRWTQPMAISGHGPRRISLSDVQPDGFEFAASVKTASAQEAALWSQLLRHSQDAPAVTRSVEPRHEKGYFLRAFLILFDCKQDSGRSDKLKTRGRMLWHEHIVVDPKILLGKPVIRGTRLAVEFVVELLANGWTREQILANYPGLTLEAILACLSYAKEVLEQERVFPSPWV